MFVSTLPILIFTSLLIKSDGKPFSFVRIYSNQAEMVQPLDKLPLEFSEEDWNDIRSDSITLVGENVNITSQTITEKQRSLNGAEIYIRSPMSFDKNTVIFVKGILIDEKTNLVQIQDQSIANQQTSYFTVSSNEIFYLEQPLKSRFHVNFTYNNTNSKISVSYLRSNLQWNTQYQLNLYHNNASTLIVMANIRNDGTLNLVIDQAELIGGDIHLHKQQSQFRTGRHELLMLHDLSYSLPMIEQGNELAGLYVFPINKPFLIDAKTNYLLPMFHPHVTIERYGLISKSFSTTSNHGKAQRAYRLRSDRFLSKGNCIIREMNRIVGETSFPNLSAKDRFEFSLGEDADIFYKEYVSLISSNTFHEEVVLEQNPSNDEKQQTKHIHTHKRLIYQINIDIYNVKTHSVKIEYDQKDFSWNFETIQLTTSTNHSFIQDGSTIKSNMTLEANDHQTYSYTIELVH